MQKDTHSPQTHTTSPTGWRFDTTYTQLPATFYVRQGPVKVKDPALVILNQPLAEQLGLDAERLRNGSGATIFAGNELPEGAEPLAQAYAGHQFGHFTMLGDGRALLLGEQVTPSGHRYDIQLKGAGQTPFSRRGDGRAALGPMLREYLISEAMHALGIPTTRSLAVTTTGEAVYREDVLPGAVLTRVAGSHIRVGTFQYAAAIDDPAALKALADYTIQRHYPELLASDQPYVALLNAVIKRQAHLIAQWLHVGFIHGVMNTDNMSICGETIDYGPCAFMDHYDPGTVFSSIDQHGRYAYANQPPIAQWNLTRFAEALLPLLDQDSNIAVQHAETALNDFPEHYYHAWRQGMYRKLGILEPTTEDAALVSDLLNLMQQHALDFTNTFRTLTTQRTLPAQSAPELQAWLTRWQQRIQHQQAADALITTTMRSANPAVIPRNHQVEAALKAAVESHDMGPFEKLLAVLVKPFDETPENEAYRSPAPPSDQVYQTFCGT